MPTSTSTNRFAPAALRTIVLCVLAVVLLSGCSTEPATEVTSSSAKLNARGTCVSACQIYFRYGTGTNTSTFLATTTYTVGKTPKDTPFGLPVSGLSANTTYNYQLCAKLSTQSAFTCVGPSGAGTFSSFTTAGGSTGGGAGSYYVDSQAGNDSAAGTSAAAAWRTLAKLNAATLKSGDRVLLARGSAWNEVLRIDANENGTAAKPIEIDAYGSGNLPQVNAGEARSHDCFLINGSHVAIRNVEASSCQFAGFDVAGSNVTMQKVVARGSVAGLFFRPTANHGKLLDSELVDNNKMSVLTPKSTHADDDSGAFGVLVHADNVEIAWNKISGSDAFSYDYGRDGTAVEIYGGSYANVHHNKTWDNETFTELGKDPSDAISTGNTFAYNTYTSASPESKFIVTRGADNYFGPVQNTVAFNNSVYLTGARSGGFVCYAGCSKSMLKLRNNAIDAVERGGYSDAPIDEDYNLYSGGVLIEGGGKVGANSIINQGRLFVNGAARDLRLKPGSLGIDRGQTIGSFTRDVDSLSTPFDGDGNGSAIVDRGAHEYR